VSKVTNPTVPRWISAMLPAAAAPGRRHPQRRRRQHGQPDDPVQLRREGRQRPERRRGGAEEAGAAGLTLVEDQHAALAPLGTDPQLLLRARHRVVGGGAADVAALAPARGLARGMLGGRHRTLAAVVDPVVLKEPDLLALRELGIGLDTRRVLTWFLVTATRTSSPSGVAPARGTNERLVPNSPVWTRAHSGWSLSRSTYSSSILPIFRRCGPPAFGRSSHTRLSYAS
jgi:hypothetical protein